MNTGDKINKVVHNTVVSAIRDMTMQNFVLKAREFKLPEQQISTLMTLLVQTVDAAYNRSNKVFMTEINKILVDADKDDGVPKQPSKSKKRS